jgi:hypothetical protein
MISRSFHLLLLYTVPVAAVCLCVRAATHSATTRYAAAAAANAAAAFDVAANAANGMLILLRGLMHETIQYVYVAARAQGCHVCK